MNEESLFCPACGVEARGRAEIASQFKRLYRPEPRAGLAYPQVYRCKGCGTIFGEPHPVGPAGSNHARTTLEKNRT